MPRHPFDALSFIAGVLFIGLGIAAFRGPLTLLDYDLDLLLPIAALAVGIGILLTLRPRGDADEPVAATGAPDVQPDETTVPIPEPDAGDDRL